MDTVIAFNTEVTIKNRGKSTSYIKHGVALPLFEVLFMFLLVFPSKSIMGLSSPKKIF